MIYQRASVLDIVSISAQQNICIVLPTLKHAIALWPMYRAALADAHGGKERVRFTKTGVALPQVTKVVRLWVPYERTSHVASPTMPMDFKEVRQGWDFASPYGKDVVPR